MLINRRKKVKIQKHSLIIHKQFMIFMKIWKIIEENGSVD